MTPSEALLQTTASAVSVALECRRALSSAPRTPSGEHSGDLVQTWLRWHERGTGEHLEQNLVARIREQVKTLIVTGFTTEELKWGLAAWTLQRMDNPRLPPTALDRLLYAYARDTRAGSARWRTTLRAQVAEFTRGI